ncbi:MAG: FKBP-type peptidyl-prolyl cis-trans isomerase [Bacteroidales bacterium]|nr:FKBP-type peptidyl-prolyl cis-trans isomerase [Bacteroidales bacterium]
MTLCGCHSGCRQYNVQLPEGDGHAAGRPHTELLIRANRQLIEEDGRTIKSFAARHGWEMKTTRSGLWYDVYHRGNGDKAAPGRMAEIACTLSLADSARTVCYSSEQSGTKTFRIGQGDVESGLEEGILLMRVGDKARLILPPHLAYGLMGDGSCIPRRAIVMYDVELLKLR